MIFLCLFLAVFCLIYYIICAVYAGIGSSFIFIWLVGAIFFALISFAVFAELKGIIKILLWVKKTFAAVMIFGVTLFVILEIMIITGMKNNSDKQCDYILVLGCQIRGDHITKSLKNRLDIAYEHSIANPKAKIIVSGGKGKGENTTEALAMKNYLVSKGVEEDRILMEDRSTDTSENMKYSAELIDNRDSVVAIATNNFHVRRSRLLAAHVGLKNTYGLPAPSDKVLFVNYMVREAIGIVKDFVAGNF